MESYSAGYVYALSNEALIRNLYKIGKTVRSAEDRAWEIYVGATGVPAPYRVALAFRVSNCDVAEARVHEALAAHRYNSDREFFLAPLETVQEVITRVGTTVNTEFRYIGEQPPLIPDGDLEKIQESTEPAASSAEVATVPTKAPIRLIRQPKAPVALNAQAMTQQAAATKQQAPLAFIVSDPKAAPQQMFVHRPRNNWDEKMMAETPGWIPPPEEPRLANGWVRWWIFVIMLNTFGTIPNITHSHTAGGLDLLFLVVFVIAAGLLIVGFIQAHDHKKAHQEWLLQRSSKGAEP